MNSLRLVIAGVKIRLWSRHSVCVREQTEVARRRRDGYFDFFRDFSGRAGLEGEVRIERVAPPLRGAKVFETVHFQDGATNWVMYKSGSQYIYHSPMKDKEQTAFMERSLSRFVIWLKPRPDGSLSWDAADVIYDFLQILLSGHLALRNRGIMLHAAGINDRGRGLVFAGESGAGKTTTSRIWSDLPRVAVFNDDRVCVTREAGGFYMHSVPWHGEFSHYIASRIRPVLVRRVFLLGHGARNSARRLGAAPAFAALYPAIFPVFWDRAIFSRQADFLQLLAETAPCYELRLVKGKTAPGFVRGI